jgi:hypothetical protein
MSYTRLEVSLPNHLVERFSLEGALRGGYYQCLPSDQCYCMFSRQVRLPKEGKCIPQCLCDDCRIDQSGLCEQDSGPSEIPGV